MTMKRQSRILATGFALTFVLGTTAFAQEPVKIGFVTELTGPWSFFGTSCVAGLKLAALQINPAGKRKIEFVTIDNQTRPDQALAASRNLDVQSKVIALSGPTSSDTALAMNGYAEQKPSAKVAVIYSDFALMRAIVAGLKYQASKAGLKIEPEILFPQGTSDATCLLYTSDAADE